MDYEISLPVLVFSKADIAVGSTFVMFYPANVALFVKKCKKICEFFHLSCHEEKFKK